MKTYTKAYMAVFPIVGKRFTKAMPERTMKMWRKGVFSSKFEKAIS